MPANLFAFVWIKISSFYEPFFLLLPFGKCLILELFLFDDHKVGKGFCQIHHK